MANDTELLAELAPLAAVIADKIRTVPVRIGPGGADDLISELTLAVAVYCGKHVLPADALALANPPYPTEDGWSVETQRKSGTWVTSGPACRPRDDAIEDYRRAIEMGGHRWPLRLIRAITTYAVEAEHTPEQP